MCRSMKVDEGTRQAELVPAGCSCWETQEGEFVGRVHDDGFMSKAKLSVLLLE